MSEATYTVVITRMVESTVSTVVQTFTDKYEASDYYDRLNSTEGVLNVDAYKTSVERWFGET